ncbi:hypothetical protein [Endozoicomonas sp.]|uniref:hypothetical protein n=1 Tax=Endozoicomonas sp. TaxID=1892382 RepID=UPI00383A412F
MPRMDSNTFNPDAVKSWMDKSSPNPKEAIVQKKNGSLDTEEAVWVGADDRKEVFCRHVRPYVHNLKNMLESNFFTYNSMKDDIKKLDSFSIQIETGEVLVSELKDSLDTLTNSPARQLCEIKNDLFQLVRACKTGDEVNTLLEKLYDCLLDCYTNKVIFMQSTIDILSRLAGDMRALCCEEFKDLMPFDVEYPIAQIEEFAAGKIQIEQALIKLADTYSRKDPINPNLKYKFAGLLRDTPEEVQKIITGDKQASKEFRVRVLSLLESEQAHLPDTGRAAAQGGALAKTASSGTRSSGIKSGASRSPANSQGLTRARLKKNYTEDSVSFPSRIMGRTPGAEGRDQQRVLEDMFIVKQLALAVTLNRQSQSPEPEFNWENLHKELISKYHRAEPFTLDFIKQATKVNMEQKTLNSACAGDEKALGRVNLACLMSVYSDDEQKQASASSSRNNRATGQQIDQIIHHLEGDVGDATLADMKVVFKQIPVHIDVIKGAACGGNDELTEILTAYTQFQSSPPQSPPPALGKLQQGAQRPRFFNNTILNPSGNVEANRINDFETTYEPRNQRTPATKRTPATNKRNEQSEERIANYMRELGTGRVSGSMKMDLTRISNQQPELLAQVTPNPQGSVSGITDQQIHKIIDQIDKAFPLLNGKVREGVNKYIRVVELNKEGIDKAEKGVKDQLRKIITACKNHAKKILPQSPPSEKSHRLVFTEGLQSENSVSKTQAKSPVFVPSRGAKSVANGAQHPRNEYPAWNVNPFMMAQEVETDGAMALASMIRPEYPGVPAANSQTQHHEQAFRKALTKLLDASANDETLFDADTPSLAEAFMAIRAQDQAGKQEIAKMAIAGSYPVRGYSHGAVSVKQGAGIQAVKNNCAIASVLMCMSHQGSLRLLISQIRETVDKAQNRRENLRTDTDNPKTNRDNVKVLEALDRLPKLQSVLVQYDSEKLESIRVNNNLDEIRRIFKLRKGVNLEPDEFFGQMVADLRSVQTFTGCSKRIEIFAIPGDNREQLKGMTTAEAFNRFYLDELSRNPDPDFVYPEVLVLAPPTFGKYERADMILSEKIEQYGVDGKLVEYQLAGSVNISEAHYVTFLRDDEKGLFYLANSMGMRLGAGDNQQFMVPTITSMPINDTEKALDDAILNTINESDGAFMHQTKEHWRNLNRNCRLAIYTKVNI